MNLRRSIAAACKALRSLPQKAAALVLLSVTVITVPFVLVYGSSDPVDGCYYNPNVQADGIYFLRYTRGGIYWYDESKTPPIYLGCYYHDTSRGWIEQISENDETRLIPGLLSLEDISKGGQSWKRNRYTDVLGAKRLIEEKRRAFHAP